MKSFILTLVTLFLGYTLHSQGNINGVVINEVLLDPSASSTPSGCTGTADDNSSDVDGDGNFEANDEFIELYNTTNTDIDISGWMLADDDGNSFTFPVGTIMAAEEYIVVISGWNGPAPQPINVFSQNLGLNNGGETIFLTDGMTCIVVRVGGSDRNDNDMPPTGCTAPFDADEDWGGDQDGSAVGRNPDGSTSVAQGTCGTSTPNMINSPLPVELTKFTGKVVANTIQLEWITASELDNSHFEIERSENGKVFKSIGVVDGKGTTLETQYYRFEDTDPLPNLNYYRLRQVDFDGTYAFSETIVLANDIGRKEFHIYPNPTNGQTTHLDYTTDQNGGLRLQITNLNGQLLLHQYFSVTKGVNSLPLDLSTLSKGMYFISLQQGKRMIRQKIVLR
ncbi:MAG: lamin tail domain-containing protein [Bacteroidota bacterium]